MRLGREGERPLNSITVRQDLPESYLRRAYHKNKTPPNLAARGRIKGGRAHPHACLDTNSRPAELLRTYGLRVFAFSARFASRASIAFTFASNFAWFSADRAARTSARSASARVFI